MKVKHTIARGTLVILLAIAIAVALWTQKTPSPQSPRPENSASQTATAAQKPMQVPPAAQQPPPVAPLNASVSPRKKISEMGVLEEMAVMAEIKKQELPEIFRAMIDANRVEHDDLKQMHLQTVFANALRRKKPTPEFLEQMYGFTTNRANSEFERGLLIGALEEAGTKESVDLLLRIAQSAPDEKMRTSASALSGVASSSMNAPDLSPMLERTWRETSNPTLLRSTAITMAKIGTASSVEMLLLAALATDGQDKARQQAAYEALKESRQPSAVPPLAARMAGQPPTGAAVELVAPILAKNVAPQAQQALVDWLKGRAEDATPLIHDLIRQRILVDPERSAWGAALDPTVPFRNEQNRKAIREALDAYRAGRIRQ